MAGLNVTASGDAGAPVLHLNGELDVRTSGVLRARLGEAIGTAEPGAAVTADLSELDFMDSSGLSVLIGAHKLARSKGSRLVLAQPSEKVLRMLDITGLSDIFDLQP